MQIETCRVDTYLPIENLNFHPENPRTIRPERLEALKKSITDKGFYQPILVWKKGNIVLSGNHRLLAARELIQDGWEFKSPDGKTNRLPVVVEDVSDEVATAMLFETNNTYAEWIDEKLKAALKDAENILDYGFTQEWVDNLLKDALSDADSFSFETGDDELGDDELGDDPATTVLTPAKYLLTVSFENDDEQQDLFLELRDRGFKVKA